jgi:hypothetical protein
MSTFEELANVRAGDVKPPVNLPAGHYEVMVDGAMTPHKAAKSGNIAMRFPVSILEAGDDVDQEELARATENKSLADRKFNMDFWMSPDARYRFTNFARSVLPEFDENLTLPQLAEQIVENKVRFTAELKYEADTDGKVDDEGRPMQWPRWDNFVGHNEG